MLVQIKGKFRAQCFKFCLLTEFPSVTVFQSHDQVKLEFSSSLLSCVESFANQKKKKKTFFQSHLFVVISL